MDATELKRQLLELLNRRPWVPIRVDATDGQFTFIDTPLRVKWEGTGIVVSRFDGPTAVIPADGVAKLTRLDEVPGEKGGMSYREFKEVYQKFRFAEPFRPYEVEMRDGTRLVVTEPGQLLAGGRTGGYFRGPRRGHATIYTADVVSVRNATLAEVA